MHPSKIVRVSAVALLLSFISLSAFALPPCGCNYCQRFPDRDCNDNGTVITCLQFLSVALCPADATSTSANALTSEESFVAALSGPTQEPAGCLPTAN